MSNYDEIKCTPASLQPEEANKIWFSGKATPEAPQPGDKQFESPPSKTIDGVVDAKTGELRISAELRAGLTKFDLPPIPDPDLHSRKPKDYGAAIRTYEENLKRQQDASAKHMDEDLSGDVIVHVANAKIDDPSSGSITTEGMHDGEVRPVTPKEIADVKQDGNKIARACVALKGPGGP